MNIYALICTRSKNLSETTSKLVSFYTECGISTKLLVDQRSIFSAYSKGVKHIKPEDDDIIILCHDDIVIRDTKQIFLSTLMQALVPDTGFMGPAGSKILPPTAIWWQSQRKDLSGEVSHLTSDGIEHLTYYGPIGRVHVLDGLFLVTSGKVLKLMDLDKPEYFEGEWDFYDLYYCDMANELGFVNKTILLDILHLSRGELVGRDSWFSNKAAFIVNHM